MIFFFVLIKFYFIKGLHVLIDELDVEKKNFFSFSFSGEQNVLVLFSKKFKKYLADNLSQTLLIGT